MFAISDLAKGREVPFLPVVRPAHVRQSLIILFSLSIYLTPCYEYRHVCTTYVGISIEERKTTCARIDKHARTYKHENNPV